MASKIRHGSLSLLIVSLVLFGSLVFSPAASIIYVYDDLNRVTRVIYDDKTVIDYIYDEAGNRTQ